MNLTRRCFNAVSRNYEMLATGFIVTVALAFAAAAPFIWRTQ